MTTEVSAVEPAPAAAPANAAPEVENPTADKPEEQQPPEKTFTQKELDEILEKRLGKERRKREELRRRLEVTEELALKSRPKEEPKPASDGEPKRDAYPDYESYIEARAEWRADRRYDEREKKARETEEESRTQAEQRKLEGSFREKAKEAAKEIEDFEEVMSAAEAPMTKSMADAILTSDIGPKLAYHLAKNPEEAERIAALPAPRQAAEIGKLEVKLSEPAKETKQPSKAPAPISPVGGKGGPSDDMPKDTDDINTWMKKERARKAPKK